MFNSGIVLKAGLWGLKHILAQGGGNPQAQMAGTEWVHCLNLAMQSDAQLSHREAHIYRNAWLNIFGEAGWGFQAALISSATVLPLLLRHHGAGPGLIALIAAVDTGLGLLPQMLGPFLFTQQHGRKRRILLWHFFPMIPCLLLLAAVGLWGMQLPAGWAAPLILVAWAGFIASIGVVSAVWVDWLAALFPDHIRGTIMGLGWGASSALGILGGLIAGWCVQRNPPMKPFLT